VQSTLSPVARPDGIISRGANFMAKEVAEKHAMQRNIYVGWTVL